MVPTDPDQPIWEHCCRTRACAHQTGGHKAIVEKYRVPIPGREKKKGTKRASKKAKRGRSPKKHDTFGASNLGGDDGDGDPPDDDQRPGGPSGAAEQRGSSGQAPQQQRPPSARPTMDIVLEESGDITFMPTSGPAGRQFSRSDSMHVLGRPRSFQHPATRRTVSSLSGFGAGGMGPMRSASAVGDGAAQLRARESSRHLAREVTLSGHLRPEEQAAVDEAAASAQGTQAGSRPVSRQASLLSRIASLRSMRASERLAGGASTRSMALGGRAMSRQGSMRVSSPAVVAGGEALAQRAMSRQASMLGGAQSVRVPTRGQLDLGGDAEQLGAQASMRGMHPGGMMSRQASMLGGARSVRVPTRGQLDLGGDAPPVGAQASMRGMHPGGAGRAATRQDLLARQATGMSMQPSVIRLGDDEDVAVVDAPLGAQASMRNVLQPGSRAASRQAVPAGAVEQGPPGARASVRSMQPGSRVASRASSMVHPRMTLDVEEAERTQGAQAPGGVSARSLAPGSRMASRTASMVRPGASLDVGGSEHGGEASVREMQPGSTFVSREASRSSQQPSRRAESSVAGVEALVGAQASMRLAQPEGRTTSQATMLSQAASMRTSEFAVEAAEEAAREQLAAQGSVVQPGSRATSRAASMVRPAATLDVDDVGAVEVRGGVSTRSMQPGGQPVSRQASAMSGRGAMRAAAQGEPLEAAVQGAPAGDLRGGASRHASARSVGLPAGASGALVRPVGSSAGGSVSLRGAEDSAGLRQVSHRSQVSGEADVPQELSLQEVAAGRSERSMRGAGEEPHVVGGPSAMSVGGVSVQQSWRSGPPIDEDASVPPRPGVRGRPREAAAADEEPLEARWESDADSDEEQHVAEAPPARAGADVPLAARDTTVLDLGPRAGEDAVAGQEGYYYEDAYDYAYDDDAGQGEYYEPGYGGAWEGMDAYAPADVAYDDAYAPDAPLTMEDVAELVTETAEDLRLQQEELQEVLETVAVLEDGREADRAELERERRRAAVMREIVKEQQALLLETSPMFLAAVVAGSGPPGAAGGAAGSSAAEGVIAARLAMLGDDLAQPFVPPRGDAGKSEAMEQLAELAGSLRKEMTVKEQELEEAKSAARTLSREVDTLRSHLDACLAGSGDEGDALRQEVGTLRAVVEKLRDRVGAAEKREDDARKELKRVQVVHADALAQLAQWNATAALLEAKVADAVPRALAAASGEGTSEDESSLSPASQYQ
ncbi:unnamed protein product [Pedinophyceae sp. YPF-701]|nr:unnamed protein product [Pedinophyceae sp. YPF-701]